MLTCIWFPSLRGLADSVWFGCQTAYTVLCTSACGQDELYHNARVVLYVCMPPNRRFTLIIHHFFRENTPLSHTIPSAYKCDNNNANVFVNILRLSGTFARTQQSQHVNKVNYSYILHNINISMASISTVPITHFVGPGLTYSRRAVRLPACRRFDYIDRISPSNALI